MTMESIIISALIIAVTILLYIVIIRSKNLAHIQETERRQPELPSIIGPAKIGMSRYQPEYSNKSHNEADGISNLEPVDEAVHPENPKQNSENSLLDIPDWEEEEEELQVYGSYQSDGGLATGITFDELATAGELLELKSLDASERTDATNLFSKIDGTGLLDLLESRAGDASKKIAMLLDRQYNGHF